MGRRQKLLQCFPVADLGTSGKQKLPAEISNNIKKLFQKFLIKAFRATPAQLSHLQNSPMA